MDKVEKFFTEYQWGLLTGGILGAFMMFIGVLVTFFS